jgi:uncharacterized membrane protein
MVNISYNAAQIVGALEPSQKRTFYHLLIGYNAVTYPICVGIACWLLIPVMRAWRELHGKKRQPKSGISYFEFRVSDLAVMRRRALAFPLWAAALSCLGWLPGGLLFPLFIDLATGPISARVFGHFLFSFTISGLIALTYSGLAVQWVVLRVLYPGLWVDGSGYRETARRELTSIDRRLRAWQFLAALIPLAGAALILTVGPEELGLWFRILAIALIGVGMGGLGMGLLIGSRIQQILAALRA